MRRAQRIFAMILRSLAAFKMRQNPQITALLKQIRAWQKAISTELSLQSESSAHAKAPRHLILILFVLRLLEQQNQGLSGFASDQRFHPGKLSPLKSQPESLAQLQQGDRLYSRLVELWRSVQPRFASLPVALELEPDLPLTDRLLRSIIGRLHQSEDLCSLCSTHLLGQIYETLLKDSPVRSSQRKSQGIYYTPAAIVQFIVQQTIDRLLESSKALADVQTVGSLPRLLDPACGGGAFLLEAYQVLLNWQLQQVISHYPTGHDLLRRNKSGEWQLSWAARQQILQHCIYGVDLDPEAVTITQISLWLKLLEGAIGSDNTPPDPLPNLNANLKIGNALLDEDAISLQKRTRETAKLDRATHPLNWETAFPAVMRSGGFDGVIGNPPYLDSEQMMLSCPTWRTYCATHYQTAIGNWDLFCVFIEKALMLCRSRGIASLIVPNKLASAPYAAQARSLLMQHRLLLIRDYAQVPVFAASVYPLVYMVQKESLPNQAPVRYEVMASLTQVQRSGWLNQNAESPEACWQFAESAVHARLMQRLQQLPTLGSIAQVYGAATVAEAYALQPWLQDCATPAPEHFRFVNSGTIDRYCLQWGKKPTRYLGQIYQHPILSSDRLHYLTARRQQQARQPKIIVAGLSQQLECLLDATGTLLAGKSTCIILGIPQSIDWRYLLALLNSHLLTAYLRDRASGNQLQSGYLRIGTAQLKSLPIYLPDPTQSIDREIYAEIIDLAQISISERLQTTVDRFTKSNAEIDLQIDQRIAHLYRLTDEEALTITQTHVSKDSSARTVNASPTRGD